MRHIKDSEAAKQFYALIEEVERGETVTIDRDGKPVVRMVPARATVDGVGSVSHDRQLEIERAIANIKEIAKRNGPITVQEILTARDEGRR